MTATKPSVARSGITRKKRIPFMLIIGEKEQEAGQVAVRVQGEGDKGAMSLEEFVEFFRSQL